MIAPDISRMNAGDKLVMTFHKNPKPVMPGFLTGGPMPGAGAAGGTMAPGAPGNADIPNADGSGGFAGFPAGGPGPLVGAGPAMGGRIGSMPLPRMAPMGAAVPGVGTPGAGAPAPAGADPFVAALLAKSGGAPQI